MPSKYQIVKRYDSNHSVWREYDKAEKYISPLRTPFYVEDRSGNGNVLSITKNNSNAPTLTIEYSYDAETWNELGTTSTTALTCAIPDNGRIYLRCITDVWSTTSYANIILCDKIHIIGGNIMSLLYGTSGLSKKTAFQNNTKYNLTRIFKENNKLTDASELILPATTLTQGCYNGMFYLCSSLVTPPALPSTSLAMDCYGSMFNGCSALTTAPALPATTLKQSCYGYMFSNCTSLTVVPALPATTLANGCYYGMFSNCVSITTPSTLPATTLAANCYKLMFDGCTSLAATPTLPATTLTSGCYLGMFNNCTHLNSASALQATTLADNCYDSMFAGCLSLITAPSLPATTLSNCCYQYMFQNCTSLTTAPILLAATLVKGCYAYMFLGCTSLNEITTYANDISASECINNWLDVVASTGTFRNLGTAVYLANSASGIPSGWTEVHQ